MRHYLMISLIASLAAHVHADSKDIVIADLKDWTGAIAFYVDAPTSIRDEMSGAISKIRDSHQADCGTEEKRHWLCSGNKFRYLRGITGAGKKVKSGFVCADEWWTSHQLYYPQQMMIDDGCIPINWSHESNAYELLWPKA